MIILDFFDPGAPPAGYSEVGVRTSQSGWLTLPATLPDATHWMAFYSVEFTADTRGCIIGFEDGNTADGFRINNQNAAGTAKPRYNWAANGFTRGTYTDGGTYAVGTRFNMLLTGSIITGNATSRVVQWDSVSGAASIELDTTAGGGAAVNYDWTSNAGLVGDMALFASGDGSRKVDVTSYRVAWWNLGSAPPDITSSGVRDNFYNSTTGVTVDPATGNALYGTPLYDIHGAQTNYANGTNLGSGSDFTSNGTFT